MHRGKCCAILFCCLLSAIGVRAASLHELNIEGSDFVLGFSGFSTVGVVFSDSSSLGFRRDNLQEKGVLRGKPDFLTDTVMGLQFNMNYQSWLSGAMQLSLRDKTDANFEDSLYLAYLDFQPNEWFSVRAGRLPVGTFLLSEHKYVGYSYTWARPPPEIYGQIPMTNYDGMDVSLRQRIGGNFLEFRAGFGRMVTTFALSDSGLFKLTFQPFYTAGVMLESADYMVRASYLQGELKEAQLGMITDGIVKLGPALLSSGFSLNTLQRAGHILSQYNPTGSAVEVFSLGGEYDNGQWLLHSEVQWLGFERALALNYTAGYLGVGYRFDDLTPYVSLANIDSHNRSLESMFPNDKPELLDLLNEHLLTDAGLVDQTTLSLGLRWDFSVQVALKLQWSYHDVEPAAAAMWYQEMDCKPDSGINTLSVGLDFIF